MKNIIGFISNFITEDVNIFRTSGKKNSIEVLLETGGHWLDKHNITVLNVAGNSEQTSPGIEQSVARYLYQVFQTYEPDESRQEQQMLF